MDGAPDDSTQIAVRTADMADLPELLRLARAFYDEDGFTTSDEDLRENLVRLLAADNAHIGVVMDDTRLCSFALTTTALILESGVVAELQDLYVDPEHRAQGIATRLIADAAQWGRAQAATSLEVVIAPNGRDVSHLFRFYAARGFRDEGRRLMSRGL